MNQPTEENGSGTAPLTSQDKVFWGLELKFIRTERGLRISGHTLVTIYLLALLLSPLLSYSLPEDALTRWSYAAGFADLIARLIPSIDKLTAVSQFPQVTRLFMALLWGVVFPIFLTLFALTILQTNHLRRMNVPAWAVWLTPLGAAAGVLLLVTMPTMLLDPAELHCNLTPFDFVVCRASDSRLWLGLFGTALPLVSAMMIVGIFKWPQIIRTYYLNKPN